MEYLRVSIHFLCATTLITEYGPTFMWNAMVGITLNNTGYGGSVSITLVVVIGYTQTNITKWAVKRIPGKLTPKIDTSTFTLEPRTYRIQAFVTDAQKATLQTLSTEPDCRCLLTDNQLTDKYVRPGIITADIKSGFDDYPWVADIEMIAEDH